MTDVRRTRGAWWGLVGASLLVSVVAEASILLIVWMAQAGSEPTFMDESWAPWVLVVLPAALAGVAAALVARLRAWGVLVPPAVAATVAALAAVVAAVNWWVAAAAGVLIGAAGAVLGVWAADRVQAPTIPAVEPREHTRRVLAGLGFCVMISYALSPLAATLADPGGPDWTPTGLLAALTATIFAAVMIAFRKPPLPVWGWVLLVAAAAVVALLSLPEVGLFAALPVVLTALGTLGLSQHLVAGLMIGALGLPAPPLLLPAGLFIAAYAVQQGSAQPPAPARETATA